MKKSKIVKLPASGISYPPGAMLREPVTGEVMIVAEVIGLYDLVSVLYQANGKWQDGGRWIQILEGVDDLQDWRRIA